MSINITELRKAMNAKNEHEQAVADYIVWQLAAMENEALAETYRGYDRSYPSKAGCEAGAVGGASPDIGAAV